MQLNKEPLRATTNQLQRRKNECGSALVVSLMCLAALFAITLAATQIRITTAKDIEDKNAQAVQYWQARSAAANIQASLIVDLPQAFDADLQRAQIAANGYPLSAFDQPNLPAQYSLPVLNPDGSISSTPARQCTSLLGNLDAWAQRNGSIAESYAAARGYGSDKARVAVLREYQRRQLTGVGNSEPAYILQYMIDAAVGEQGNVRGRVRPSGTIMLGPSQPACNTTVSLTPNPSSITLGNKSTLTATYTNANHVWLTDQNGNLVPGTDTTGLTETNSAQTISFTVSPTVDTSYRALGQGANGCQAISAFVTVTVIYPPPLIVAFDATPLCITRGETSTLSFQVQYAATITITGGGVNQTFPGNSGTTPTSGSLAVSPTVDTTYTLTATGPGGTASRTVTVQVKQPLTIDQFSSDTYCLTPPSNTVNLAWAVSNAETVTIADNSTGIATGVSPSGGTRSFTVNNPTTFTLTATRTGCNGPEAVTRTISINTNAVPTASFSANPNTITLGDTTTLQWNTTNTTSVTISASPATGSGLPAPQTATASGTLAIQPTAINTNPGYTYTLTATNAGCNTQTITLTTTVTVSPAPAPPPCPNVNSFDGDSCIVAGQNATLRWNVASADFVDITGPGVNQTFSANPVGTGSMTVTPGADATYTLTARRVPPSCTPASPPFPTTATFTVHVGQVPSVSALTASPSVIDFGQGSRLTWNESGNLSSVRVIGSGGDANTYVVPPGQRFMDVRPPSTSNYTVVVTSNDCAGQSANQSTTVTVAACPAITVPFSASPSTIFQGASSTLQWGIANASQVLLNGSPVAASGSLAVSPSATTNYRLTAVSRNGSCSFDQFVTITVNTCPAPVINSFTTTPSSVLIGGNQVVRLAWSVNDTSGTGLTVTISGIGSFAGGSGFVDISQPQSTTTYTLAANNGCGNSATAQRTVTASACPAPGINSFTATPNTVWIGGNATVRLAWSIADTSGTGVTINIPGVGTFANPNGFVDITQPQATTTYTLNATSGCGATSSAQATVTANTCPSPTINSFTANPNNVTIGGGQTVRLSWTVTDNSGTGVTVNIAGIGTFGANGFVDIPQGQSTTTYTLTATAGCGAQSSAQTTITASACPTPGINSFTATPNSVTIGGGQTVRLAWSVTDPSGTGVTVTIAGIGTWSGTSGFVDIAQPQSTTTYSLAATAGCGASTPAQTTVTASPPTATTASIDLPFFSPTSGGPLWTNPNDSVVSRFPGTYTFNASAGSPATASIQWGPYPIAFINTCYGTQTFVAADGPWVVNFVAADNTILDSFSFDRPGYDGGTLTWTGSSPLSQSATKVVFVAPYYTNRYQLDRVTNECELVIDHYHGGYFQGVLDLASGVYTNGPPLFEEY